MIIKLMSNDNELFEIDDQVARMSITIKTMLEQLGLSEEEAEPIPIPNVSGSILRKVIEWATHHKDDPPPLSNEDDQERRSNAISPWDVDFLKVEQGTLFEIILAANFLDIKCLLDIACKAVASIISGKNPEEIRQAFNIKNDFTSQEEEQILRENEWCTD